MDGRKAKSKMGEEEANHNLKWKRKMKEVRYDIGNEDGDVKDHSKQDIDAGKCWEQGCVGKDEEPDASEMKVKLTADQLNELTRCRLDQLTWTENRGRAMNNSELSDKGVFLRAKRTLKTILPKPSAGARS